MSGLYIEDLIIDNGAVTFDGGYDCSFAPKPTNPAPPSSRLLGTITITSSGSLIAASNTDSPNVVSVAQCDFDIDLDGYTSVGSCTGSADDCDDNDSGVNPDAEEVPLDGIDQDCSGADLTYAGESCDDCHTPATAWHNWHDATTPPDATCVTCHASHVNNVLLGHYGDTVRTDGNNMSAGETIVCTSCHVPYINPTTVHSAPHPVRDKVLATWNGSQYVNLTCDTCHENRADLHGASSHTIEVGPNDLSYSAPGQLCSSCHVVANWAEIESIEHNVPTNGDGSCVTCHNSPRQEVQNVIAAATTPIFCLDCHSNKELTVHGTVDHVGLGYVTGEATCLAC
ncbi:MAG: cytochrome c3 family protein, partial [Desulfuromonadales bacterium]